MTAPAHRLHELDCGTMTMQRQFIFAVQGTEPLTLPIRAFVITHPRGDVLVDSGLPLEAIEDPDHWSWLQYATWSATPANHVRAQIETAGLDPAAIRYVVQSHLHYDHIGGIGHFPGAQFIVHRREWQYAHQPSDWISRSAYPLADIDRPGVDWRQLDLTPEDRELDLYGDGRIRIVFSPGHAVGQLSVVARLDDRTVLITGDAADSEQHWERGALPPYVDLPALATSLDNLHRLEAGEGVDQVIFAHELGRPTPAAPAPPGGIR